jgi:hypothetical protein
MSKKVVVYGFTDIEFNSIFTYVEFKREKVNSLDEGFKKSGLIFLIKEEALNMTWEELDYQYRSKNKYERIIVICDSFNKDESVRTIKYKEDKYARICNLSSIDLFSSGFPDYVEDLYEDYKKNKKSIGSVRITKLGYLIKIYDYIKKKREATISEIADKYSLNRKSVERYVSDLYNAGVEIGYDKKKRSWYYCGKS